MALQWKSIDGGTYKVESSDGLASWTVVAAASEGVAISEAQATSPAKSRAGFRARMACSSVRALMVEDHLLPARNPQKLVRNC